VCALWRRQRQTQRAAAKCCPALALRAEEERVGDVHLVVGADVPHVAVVPVVAVVAQHNAVLRVKNVDQRDLVEDARGRAHRDDVCRLQA
jgi:hypothetical protein